MPNEGIKFDEGKVRMDLLPPEFLESTAKVLTFGANKYSEEFLSEWQRLLSVEGVKRVNLYTVKGSVDLVMRKDSEKTTLLMRRDNEKTLEIGDLETLNGLDCWKNVEKVIQSLEPETLEPNGSPDWQTLDLTKYGMSNYVRMGVKYVDQPDTYTLTTVILRGNSEVSFVASATTVSECLEIIWKACKEQLGISKPLKVSEGDRNWELGMAWSRPFGALMRHMWAWWRGEEADPETGYSHLAHAACCIAFLISYEQRGVGEDDRPREANYAVKETGK